jgi:zinc protease
MRSLAVTKENFENQRETVKEERRLRIDNQPYTGAFLSSLTSAFDPTACFAYAHETIGSMDDLNAATTEDVQAFFRQYYAPNNATLVVTGDFDAAEVKRLVQQYFGEIPRAAAKPAVACEQPFDVGQQRRTVTDAKATLPAVLALWRIPEYKSGDTPALTFLATILGQGASSRMNRTVVREAKAAVQAQTFAGLGPRRGPNVFAALGIANQGVRPDSLERLMLAEVARVAAGGVTEAELQKAKNAYLAEQIDERQRNLGRAEAVHTAAMFLGDPNAVNADLPALHGGDRRRHPARRAEVPHRQEQRDHADHPRDAQAVTVAMTTARTLVRHAASGAALLAGFLTASGAAAHAQYPTQPPAPAPVKPAAFPPFQEVVLPNGLRVVLVESHRDPVVAFRLALPAGRAYTAAGNEGAADMVATLLTKGANGRTADEVATLIESAGGSFQGFAGTDDVSLAGNVLSNQTALAMQLLADAVTKPTFAEREVELVRTQALSALRLEEGQPGAIAQRAFNAALYGAHPYGRAATPATVRAITRADLLAFHGRRVKPRGALLVVAGDVTMAQLRPMLERAFAGWTGAPAATPTLPAPPARARSEIVLVHRPGSVQSNIVAGNLTAGPADPTRYAATIANKLLGGGADARLFTILREQKGWTYGAYSNLTRPRGTGAFSATAEVRTEVTDSALVEMLGQLRRTRQRERLRGGPRQRPERPRRPLPAHRRDGAADRRAGRAGEDARAPRRLPADVPHAARGGERRGSAGRGAALRPPRAGARGGRRRRRQGLRPTQGRSPRCASSTRRATRSPRPISPPSPRPPRRPRSTCRSSSRGATRSPVLGPGQPGGLRDERPSSARATAGRSAASSRSWAG